MASNFDISSVSYRLDDDFNEYSMKFSHSTVSCSSSSSSRSKSTFSGEEKNSVVHLLTSIGLRNVINPAVENLQKKYQKLYLKHHSEIKLKLAMDLVSFSIPPNSSKLEIEWTSEKKEMKQLIKHRENVFKYADEIGRIGGSEREIHRILKELVANINLLENGDHPNITALKNGSTCFAVPLWFSNHAIYCVFKKVGETYFFEFHNRGCLVDDIRLHGSARFEIGKKTYAKTIVTIKTTKENLQEDAFLKTLISACGCPDGHLIYDCIYSHFILSNKGTIVKSQEEVLLEELHKNLNNPFIAKLNKQKITQIAALLIKLDSNFNSLDAYQTCVESNMTTVEKQIISKSTKWNLTKFSLEYLINELEFFKTEFLVDLEVIKSEVGTIVNDLQVKLKKQTKTLAKSPLH